MASDMDTAALTEIVRRLQAGWNAADADAFAAPFAADADYVVADGQFAHGRALIAAGHRQLFAGPLRGSRNAGTVEAIRLLRPDVALVRLRWHLRFSAPDGQARESEARVTLVCAQAEGDWEIVSFQNTPIDPRAVRIRVEEAAASQG